VAQLSFEDWMRQGRESYAEAQYVESERFFRRALQHNPNDRDAHVWLGSAFYGQGKLEEAIASYRRALQIDPNDALAHNNLGVALADQGKLEEAIASYRRALSLPENRSTTPASAHTLAHNALGYALQQQGDLGGAIAAYERALALDPNFTSAQNNLIEARRQRAAQVNPQPVVRDDAVLAYLPDVSEEPNRDLFRSTVLVVSENTSGTDVGLERGSGWVVAKQGRTLWIVTNRHVVIQDNGNPRSNLSVEFYGGDLPAERRHRYPATLLHHTAATGDDNSLDLALLKVENAPDDIQPLPFASGRFGSGSEIRVIGHPYAGMRALEWHLSQGNVGRYDPNQTWFALEATIAYGNSGGPVLNEAGQVIGLITNITTASDINLQNVSLQNVSGGPGQTQDSSGGYAFAFRADLVQTQLRTWGTPLP
jgi:superkiller protein 3